jgi:ribosomal protein S18 acetylase RimI-like enzyme
MSIELRLMREDEFPEWKANSVGAYATDMHVNGGVPRDAADAKATSDFDGLLGQGVETPDQFLHVIEEDGAVVGHLWTAARTSPIGRVLFVYEVRVSEQARGRGLGREAMKFAERFAREQRLDRIELNVMGGNEVARGLYRSLGYDEVAVYMGKTI